MAFGDLMNSTAPPAAVPSTGGAPAPQGPTQLEGSWKEYLSHPSIQAGLLQFGLSMMSPMGPGQTFAGHLAGSVAQGGQALGRVEDRNIALEDRQREFEQQQAAQALQGREVGARERAVSTQEEQNRITREGLFNQSVRESPEHQGAVERAKIQAQLDSGLLPPLSPSDMAAALAQVPSMILSGQKVPEKLKNDFVQAAMEYSQDRTVIVTDPLTRQPTTQLIKGQPLTMQQKLALQAIGAQLPTVEPAASGVGRRAEAPEAPPVSGGGINIAEIASRGQLTGPVSGALQILGRAPGGVLTTAQTQQIEQGRTTLEIRKGALIRALSVNPRFAEGERQAIEQSLNLDPKWWDSGDAMLPRLVAVDDNLVRLRDAAVRDLRDPNLDVESETQIRSIIRAIDNFRIDFLPAARAETPEAQAELMEYIKQGLIPQGTPILYKTRDGRYAIGYPPAASTGQPQIAPSAPVPAAPKVMNPTAAPGKQMMAPIGKQALPPFGE